MKEKTRILWPLLAVLLGGAAQAAPPVPAAPGPGAGPAAVPTVAFEELVRGQKGYAFTVFAGSEPERFEVEVLGIQKANEVAGLDYLITRLSGHGLEKIGVAGGMSGSPVYFDGKLAGAVAFTFNFASEPIAGVTPIAAMRAIPNTFAESGQLPPGAGPPARPAATRPTATRPTATRPSARPAARPAGMAPPRLADLFDDDPGAAAFASTLELLAPQAPSGGRPALTFAAAGLGGEAERLLAGRLGPLAAAVGTPNGTPSGAPALAPALAATFGGAAGGSALGGAGAGPSETAAAARELAAGDSVALVMARGDISFGAVGTATDRIGDQVVAFGHRVLGGMGGIGPVRFPMAAADVITVMPSLQGSFKMANIGPLVGSFLEDRGPGSRAMVGPVWPMTPLEVVVHPSGGRPARTFEIEVAPDPLFRGFTIALATVGSISAAGRDQGAQSIDLDLRYRLRGYDDVVARHSFTGGQAAVEAAFQVMEYATWLAFNEFEPVELEGVEVEVRVYEEEQRTKVLAAWPDRRKVKPGETLGFYVELQDYRGEKQRHRMEFPIPADASPGPFYLMIGDGRSADNAYAQLEKIQPRTLEQGLALLRRARSARDLHVIALEGGPGINFGGHPMPDLPGSQRALLGPGAESVLPWRIAGEKVLPLDRAAAGMVRIDLQVERR